VRSSGERGSQRELWGKVNGLPSTCWTLSSQRNIHASPSFPTKVVSSLLHCVQCPRSGLDGILTFFGGGSAAFRNAAGIFRYSFNEPHCSTVKVEGRRDHLTTLQRRPCASRRSRSSVPRVAMCSEISSKKAKACA
jgi:hypothetical protein